MPHVHVVERRAATARCCRTCQPSDLFPWELLIRRWGVRDNKLSRIHGGVEGHRYFCVLGRGEAEGSSYPTL